MKTKTLNLCILLLLCYSNTFSQSMGNSKFKNTQSQGNQGSYQNRNQTSTYASFDTDSTFIVEANVMMNVSADKYVAIFNVNQAGDNLEALNILLSERVKGFMDEISNLGIPANTCFIDIVSQIPVYEMQVDKKIFSKSMNEVPIGFQIQQNIHVPLDKESLLPKLLQSASKFEIYDFVKLDYIVTNQQAILDTLRNQAVTIIGKKLVAYSKLGVKYKSKFMVISEKSNSVSPTDRYSNYTAFSTTPMLKSKRNSEVNFAPKNTTYYYDRLNYDGFDLVLNPIIVAPVVQITFNLRLKYSLLKGN